MCFLHVTFNLMQLNMKTRRFFLALKTNCQNMSSNIKKLTMKVGTNELYKITIISFLSMLCKQYCRL